MFDRLKAQWQQLKQSKPGQRFQDRYRRHKQDRNGPKLAWRVVRIAAAVALLAVGGVFVLIPGPAILFFFFAGALLATDSLPVAKLLDWSEVKIRAIVGFLRRHWKKLPTAGKVAVASVGVGLSATVTVLFYRFVAD